jgi:hypothetical protein
VTPIPVAHLSADVATIFFFIILMISYNNNNNNNNNNNIKKIKNLGWLPPSFWPLATLKVPFLILIQITGGMSWNL